MPEAIKVVWCDELPFGWSAASDAEARIIYLSHAKLDGINKNWLEFIIGHEEAHILHDTDNEFVCDAYGFYKAMYKGLSTKDAIKALSRVLDFEHPDEQLRKQNWERFKKQEQRAISYEHLQKV